MKEFVGKKCNIHVKIKCQDLFYEAIVLDFDSPILTFVDKFGKTFSFNKDFIQEIDEVKYENPK
jgi:hypothetical protein